jgi:magnesium chelatase family protein
VVRVRPVATLSEAAEFLAGEREVPPVRTEPESLISTTHRPQPDLADVRGQETAKRALEVAAAGGHDLLLAGPPGAGKTMLARRLPGILPPLTLPEALEVTSIHSVAGELGESPLVTCRPFRAPHHSISLAGLIGGGPQARPGETSLAHHGVLFLDELPEFDRRTLDALRQPLEEGTVRIVRVAYSVRYPARFTLIAAMNPCRCGRYGSPAGDCRCTPREVAAYRHRISGPLLDRLDMRIDVPAVRWSEMSGRSPGESTPAVAARVLVARERQSERLAGTPFLTNAAMSVPLLRRLCPLNRECRLLLARALRRHGLSARGHDRVVRVARTIADLALAEGIEEAHLAEALVYRQIGPDDP